MRPPVRQLVAALAEQPQPWSLPGPGLPTPGCQSLLLLCLAMPRGALPCWTELTSFFSEAGAPQTAYEGVLTAALHEVAGIIHNTGCRC